LSEKENSSSFTTLVDIIAKLRSPEGCPWDREQTHSSIMPNLIEECYEAIEAFNQGNSERFCEELGDLLMQVVFHAQLASEEGKFCMEKVLQSINDKLIRRHPHVFGDMKMKDAQEVLMKWEDLKQKERGQASALSGVPKGMPALARGHALQQRAARVGFDWQEMEGVIEKLVEEVNELQQAADRQEIVEEFGDLLFTLANVARRMKVDLEEALHLANEKFQRRFSHMEELCRQRGISLVNLSLAEQDALWEEAKRTLSDGRGERI